MSGLGPQVEAAAGVQVLAFEDGGERPIGAKRQALLEAATADYVSYVDDDDEVAGDFVARVLACINGPDAPDVIGFRLRYWRDGEWAGSAVHTYNPAAAPTPGLRLGVTRMERQPNHLNPVRRELALAVGFPPSNHGEDADYARRLAAMNPREAFIDAIMYEYQYRSARPGELTNAMRSEGRRK